MLRICLTTFPSCLFSSVHDLLMLSAFGFSLFTKGGQRPDKAPGALRAAAARPWCGGPPGAHIHRPGQQPDININHWGERRKRGGNPEFSIKKWGEVRVKIQLNLVPEL